jgi:hypothetical protein
VIGVAGNLEGPDGEAPARKYRHTDPTTAADRCRIRDARIDARERLRGVRRDDASFLRRIFQEEIGKNVRSVSPFLLSFVASKGESIDLLVDRIAPAPRWPRAPALSSRPVVQFRRPREPYREFYVSTASGDRKVVRVRGFGHGMIFMHSGDDWACLEVVDHSLEIEVRIGPLKLETLFGVLRIELDHRLPDTLAAACLGRLAGEVVDHAALRGRDWRITAIEEPSSFVGQTLVIETGSTAFRMPWTR